jgi:3-dehydroquinate dehydratase type I
MICLCIGKPSVALCQELLPGVELAEIRLDGAELSPHEIQRIFTLHANLIATFRPNAGDEAPEKRKMALLTAVEAGAAYVDIEIEAGTLYKKEIMQTARQQECQVILSYHNHENTPSKKQLETIIEQCFSQGADIAKIACRVHSEADSARILSLYDYPGQFHHGKITAIGMGEKGKITRLAALLLGAPFTYASQSTGRETAPGQLDKDTLEKILGLMEPCRATMQY